MAREKILVVDDEANIRLLCNEILARHDYLPTCVDSPSMALRAVEEESFDLLMTDISMPEMDGLQLLQSIREFQEDLPAIVITGHGRLDQAIHSLHLGAQAFIVKPFTQQELLQTIQETLEKNRLTKENLRLKLLVPLFEISQNLLLEVNPVALFEQIVNVASKETKSDQAILILKEDMSGALEIKAAFPPLERDADAIELFRKIGRKTIEAMEAVIHVDGGGLDTESSELLKRCGFSSLVSIPLSYQGKIPAVLSLFKRVENIPYNQSDIELISILSGQAVIAIENAKLFDQLERSHFESMKALAQAIEAKDLYTRGHCDRMVTYALAIADRLGLSADEKKHLGYGAALHDIGKIGIHELILNKSGKLTDKEYEIMKDHPMLGAEIIKGVDFLNPVVPMIYYHQERYDGKGYPEGLSGEEIPIGARIIAILDTFDAMTSDRPYRKALPMEVAFAELRRCTGSQFDPKIVETLIQIIQDDQKNLHSD
ncbi:MAG: response regulator [Candidatus Manganitrophaceae bacterium]|nr:MAG: response regulator [Candidatus Manganitrophaceae bacterium]